MSEPKTARERFVEAMVALFGHITEPRYLAATRIMVEDACDAFADVECCQMETYNGTEWADCPNDDHDSCRAAIRREVFDEEAR